MAERPMETTLCTALWQQFGAAIDMLENALLACPDVLWHERLWGDPSLPPGFASFWYVTSHTLFWLDLYLTGSPEGFAPPAPFNPDDDLPERPYTREELHAYLLQLRQKCQTIITELSYEQAQQQVDLPWRRKPSYFELLLYTLRHVQEHAAQLSLFLGQHGIPDEALGWVGRAKEEAGLLGVSGRDHRTDTCLPALTSNVFCPRAGAHPSHLGIIWRGVPMGYHFISPISLGTGMVWGLCTLVKKFLPPYAAKSQEGSRDGYSTAGDAGNRTAR